jgi:hypothetical protein
MSDSSRVHGRDPALGGPVSSQVRAWLHIGGDDVSRMPPHDAVPSATKGSRNTAPPRILQPRGAMNPPPRARALRERER